MQKNAVIPATKNPEKATVKQKISQLYQTQNKNRQKKTTPKHTGTHYKIQYDNSTRVSNAV